MTRVEYILLREQETHLSLPPWHLLGNRLQQVVLEYSREQLIANRASRLLSMEVGARDVLGAGEFLPSEYHDTQKVAEVEAPKT